MGRRTSSGNPEGVRRPCSGFIRGEDRVTRVDESRVVRRAVAPIGRAADSKSAGWGFESLLPCQLPVASSELPDAGRFWCFGVFQVRY